MQQIFFEFMTTAQCFMIQEHKVTHKKLEIIDQNKR